MISFVCGQLCSGKTLYSKALAHICGGIYIEVGDIVRSFKQTEDRKILQDSKHLAEAIIEHLWNEANINSKTDIVVSGVRQQAILQSFPESTLLWIECTKTEREKRYKQRAREGDTQTFEEAEQGDINLGILNVKQYIFNDK
jgi:cytidylate kinase